MKKVLIIEDDLDLALEMKRTLEHWQFDVRLTKAFNQIIETFLEYEPMIIILDINLPFFDGFYWCEKIRQISTVPIIFLSSRDSTPRDNCAKAITGIFNSIAIFFRLLEISVISA